MLSPCHGVLVADWRAELLFDASEALVEAVSLVNDRDIRQVEPEAGVEYFHILFDRHEPVFAEGQPTESFFLGPNSLSDMGAAARAEIETLFPGLLANGRHDGEIALRIGAAQFAALRAL